MGYVSRYSVQAGSSIESGIHLARQRIQKKAGICPVNCLATNTGFGQTKRGPRINRQGCERIEFQSI